MFTRKKRLIERKGFYITIAAILAVGFLVGGLVGSPEKEEEPELTANVKQSVSDNNSKKQDTKREIVKSDSINKDFEENNVQELQSSEYYLVKESDGFIKIYQYDIEGHESLLRTTDILFSLLSEEDQGLFNEGVTVYTEDELLDLLQDFES